MSNQEFITLQQDSRKRLKVAVPKDQIESEVKRIMRYRNTGRQSTYLERLYREGTANFNDAIESLARKFGTV